MDSAEFRRCAKELVDYVADYLDRIRERSVLPDVQPGYMRELLPDSAPKEAEHWKTVLQDVERVIMRGMTHWNSPHFHAYFPIANSYPSMCADILLSGITTMGFSWISSPACTELEMLMMDWLGKMLELPEQFLFESEGLGGGVIQGSASESTLVALLAARNRALTFYKGAKLENLVVYASDQSHSSVERATLYGAVMIRLLPADENLSLRGDTLAKAIEEDRKNGNLPFLVVGSLGTTNTCAFDNIKEIGEICVEQKLWLHIDAAYAGAAFICPEFRCLLDGIEYADSFVFNPHKWLLVNFECSTMWVKNRLDLTEAFFVNPTYLKYKREGPIPDYRHWQIPLGRRFRALKMWFVFRMYGVDGLRKHIREHVRLAKEFESLIASDPQFEVVCPVTLGLVCFRLKGSNSMNEALLQLINDRRKIHIVSTYVRGQLILRFVICSRFTNSEDIKFAFIEFQEVAAQVKKRI